MLVVLEGVDGAGKTTLAQLLAPILDAKIIHCTKETPNDWDYFSKILDEAQVTNIIADRFFWGQFVYQPFKERRLSNFQRAQLERRLHEEGGKLIYVYAFQAVITSRLCLRGEIPALPVSTLLKNYEDMLLLAECPVIKYDTYTKEVSVI